MMGRLILTAAVLILLASPAWAGGDTDGLQGKLKEIVSRNLAPMGRYGILVKSMDSGKVLFESNSAAPLVPASNMKMVTSAAALTALGPEFCYKTEVVGLPSITDPGAIEGNLYLVGSGDPTFVEPFVPGPEFPFEVLVRQLWSGGLRQVSGDLVGDDLIFDRQFLGKGWAGRHLGHTYAAPCGGLSFNGNLLELNIAPDRICTVPSNALLRIEDQTKGSGAFRIVRMGDSLVLRGRKPRSANLTMPVANPPLYALGAFASILRAEGIAVKGKVRLVTRADLPLKRENMQSLAAWESRPLIEILGYMNKESSNFTAEHIFKTIGAEKYGRGTQELSARAMAEFVRSTGAPVQGLVIADGSGLSSLNRISARQLASVLEHLYNHPHGQLYLNSLAYAGMEGTMSSRLAGVKAVAKTGTLRNVTALSGYLETENGETLIFCILINFSKGSTWKARSVENRIVRILANY
jgi:D-alanyl-D-alanine carboxypeptidase/D-alanyl-D-alanine-endopeptidase (penicillin-binding protein 4)